MSSKADISFFCPHCRKSLVVDSAGAGLRVNCPGCQRSITVPSTPTTTPPRLRKCPYCAEFILLEAVRCKHCHADLVANGKSANQNKPGAGANRIVAGLLAIFFGAFGIHKFVMGYSSAGIIMLCVSLVGMILFAVPTFVMAVIALIEGIKYLSMNDAAFQKTYIDGRQPWM